MLRGWKPREIAALPPHVRQALHWALWVDYWHGEYADTAASFPRKRQILMMLTPPDPKE